MDSTFDVIDVNHIDLMAELLGTFEHKVPLFIWGPPGIGKSYSAVEACRRRAKAGKKLFAPWNRLPNSVRHALAEDTAVNKDKLGMLAAMPENAALLEKHEGPWPVQDIFIFGDMRLAQRDASDLNGLPMLSAGNFVEWRPQLLFLVLSRQEIEGMLLLDEIPQALPIVQNAAYQIIQDRASGELTFSDQLAIVGAGNRLTDGGTQYQMPPALANRFVHTELIPPSAEQFADWGIDYGIDSRIISFIRFRPQLLMDQMDVVRKNRAMAWGSPRSWEKASTMIQGITSDDKAGLNHVYRRVSMAVGKSKAIELRAFLESIQKLDLKAILADPSKVGELDLGLKWALITGLAEYYRAHKSALDEILGVCEKLEPDFSASMLRMIRRYDRSQFATRLLKCPRKQVALGLLPYFED